MQKKFGNLVYKSLIISLIFVQGLYLFLFQLPQHTTKVDSGSLTVASDSLSNSRLSFYGKVNVGYSAFGTSYFTLQSSGNSDNNNAHLFPQDTVNVGFNLGMTVASVAGTLDFSTIAGITSQLGAGNPVTATQSAIHTITFTTASSVTNGTIRAYIPAADNTFLSNNGGVDTAGFDLNGVVTGDVTCTGGAATWGTPTVTASTTNGSNLHLITCPFTGTALASGVAVTMTIGNTNKMVNPAPKLIHTQGLADTYTIKLQEIDTGTSNVLDNVNLSVSVIEGVLVSATIMPSLTFQIQGVAAGVTRCGQTTGVVTTATTVPFGELNGNDIFYNAAHTISISTNATSGYVVKVAETDSMKKPIVGTSIPDTACNVAANDCTDRNTTGLWTTTSRYGFGYSLETLSGSPTLAFVYTSGSVQGNCPGSSAYCARPFGNIASLGSPAAQTTIASSTGPTATQSFYACYRLNYSAIQNTGYYQTQVMYFPSATF
ncbi:MAG: hypothetical protein Q7R95_07725 [bacterium]|nr:hypothetical protein [bacterium]